LDDLFRIDTPLMFPTPSGMLWWERDVWYPAQEAWAGIDPALERPERRRLVAERGRDFAPPERPSACV